MANKGIENLQPIRDTETAKARGKLGGIKSGIVKREKKMISKILADYLQKEHDVVLRDDSGAVIDKEKISAEELIQRTITAIMTRGDSASAAMIKTLGELTEGKNIKLNGSLNVSRYDYSKLTDAQLEELEKLTKKIDVTDTDA